MKSTLLALIAWSVGSSAVAAGRGEEKTYSCNAAGQGVSHQLQIVLQESVLTHISLSSVNQKNGDDCELEVGNNTQLDATGSQWEDWNGSTLIRIKDGEHGPKSDIGQTIFVLKESGGYRVFVSPEAGRVHCGLHGYLASSVGITLGKKQCKLTW